MGNVGALLAAPSLMDNVGALLAAPSLGIERSSLGSRE